MLKKRSGVGSAHNRADILQLAILNIAYCIEKRINSDSDPDTK